MTPEEQVSYLNTLEQDTVQRLIKNEAEPDWDVPAVARLDVSLLQMLHEVMFGAMSHGGLIRAVMVQVADGKGGAAYTPPRRTSSGVNCRVTALGGEGHMLTRSLPATRSVCACSRDFIMESSR
jgi:hypothetical protein